MKQSRKCAAKGCQKSIHWAHRSDKIYGSDACKVRAHRNAKKEKAEAEAMEG